jgi:hypothetical protein
MKSHSEIFTARWHGKNVAGTSPVSFDSYLAEIAVYGTALCALELQAIAVKYNLPIALHCDSDVPMVFNRSGSKNLPWCHLWFHDSHYSFLKPNLPQQGDDALVGIPDSKGDMSKRGGGKHSDGDAASASSFRTRSSVVRRALVSAADGDDDRRSSISGSSFRTRASVLSRARSSASLRQNPIAHASKVAPPLRLVDADMDEGVGQHEPDEDVWHSCSAADVSHGRKSITSWICPVQFCGWRPRGAATSTRPLGHYLTAAGAVHMAKKHPGIDINAFGGRSKVSVRQLSSSVTPIWSCSHCSMGTLEPLSSLSTRRAIVRHGRDAHPQLNQDQFRYLSIAGSDQHATAQNKKLWRKRNAAPMTGYNKSVLAVRVMQARSLSEHGTNVRTISVSRGGGSTATMYCCISCGQSTFNRNLFMTLPCVWKRPVRSKFLSWKKLLSKAKQQHDHSHIETVSTLLRLSKFSYRMARCS